MAGNIVDQDKRALKILLRLDAIRGEDSTGLAVVLENDNKIEVFKKVGGPDVLFQEPAFGPKNTYCGPSAKVFIGHNRAATKGKITDANAHPFVHNGVVGAHNGTLNNVSRLEDGHKFEVDSEAIIYNLSKYEVDSVVPDIDGAYALTWYDDTQDAVFIIRNKERDLYHTRRKDRDVIYWASEAWMLEVALRRLGISHDEVKLFEKDRLHKLDVSDSTMGFRKVEWEDKGVLEGYKYVYVPPKHNNNSSNVFNGGKKSNVLPFNPSSGFSGNSRSNAEVMMMKMMEGSDFLFRFKEVKLGVGKSRYLSAFPDDPMFDWDIRIYGANHKNWVSWINKCHTTVFKGNIKRVVDNWLNGKRETYFLIDLRTIVEQLDDLPERPGDNDKADITDQWYEGYQGRWISHEEWLQLTKKGCANCSCNASEYDADLEFIDHDDFLCGKCVDQFPEYTNHNVMN